MSDQINLNLFPGSDQGAALHSGKPHETLFAYSIDPLNGAPAPGQDSFVLSDPSFPILPQTVVSPNSSPILSGGEHFTIVGQTDVQTYIGTATDVTTGKIVGFIFEDSTTGEYFLFSKHPHLWPGTQLNLNLSTGPNDPNDVNWNLKTGQPVCYCFLAGTAVMTPNGEVAVETLKTGDMVVLSDGRVAPINWLGVQTISTRFADPLRVMPVRIAAGALGGGLPKRDLLISPDHAVLFGGLLVQAGAMVNDLSITREAAMPETFIYYHVEVADHSFILAEGVPAETFVDNVSRMAFDNWEEREEVEAIVEMSLPRVKSTRQLPVALRHRLQAQAAHAQPDVAA
ncbi:MAG: Hint domain-containing protein [Proteobacteria bacterium]|nr:Hint domain-containing protein [Pseudomonadota bacterium]